MGITFIIYVFLKKVFKRLNFGLPGLPTLQKYKRFMLDEKLQRTVSNFAIFLEYYNPHVVFFVFSFLATLFFLLMNALFYVDIDQEIH